VGIILILQLLLPLATVIPVGVKSEWHFAKDPALAPTIVWLNNYTGVLKVTQPFTPALSTNPILSFSVSDEVVIEYIAIHEFNATRFYGKDANGYSSWFNFIFGKTLEPGFYVIYVHNIPNTEKTWYEWECIIYNDKGEVVASAKSSQGASAGWSTSAELTQFVECAYAIRTDSTTYTFTSVGRALWAKLYARTTEEPTPTSYSRLLGKIGEALNDIQNMKNQFLYNAFIIADTSPLNVYMVLENGTSVFSKSFSSTDIPTSITFYSAVPFYVRLEGPMGTEDFYISTQGYTYIWASNYSTKLYEFYPAGVVPAELKPEDYIYNVSGVHIYSKIKMTKTGQPLGLVEINAPPYLGGITRITARVTKAYMDQIDYVGDPDSWAYDNARYDSYYKGVIINPSLKPYFSPVYPARVGHVGFMMAGFRVTDSTKLRLRCTISIEAKNRAWYTTAIEIVYLEILYGTGSMKRWPIAVLSYNPLPLSMLGVDTNFINKYSMQAKWQNGYQSYDTEIFLKDLGIPLGTRVYAMYFSLEMKSSGTIIPLAYIQSLDVHVIEPSSKEISPTEIWISISGNASGASGVLSTKFSSPQHVVQLSLSSRYSSALVDLEIEAEVVTVEEWEKEDSVFTAVINWGTSPVAEIEKVYLVGITNITSVEITALHPTTTGGKSYTEIWSRTFTKDQLLLAGVDRFLIPPYYFDPQNAGKLQPNEVIKVKVYTTPKTIHTHDTYIKSMKLSPSFIAEEKTTTLEVVIRGDCARAIVTAMLAYIPQTIPISKTLPLGTRIVQVSKTTDLEVNEEKVTWNINGSMIKSYFGLTGGEKLKVIVEIRDVYPPDRDSNKENNRQELTTTFYNSTQAPPVEATNSYIEELYASKGTLYGQTLITLYLKVGGTVTPVSVDLSIIVENTKTKLKTLSCDVGQLYSESIDVSPYINTTAVNTIIFEASITTPDEIPDDNARNITVLYIPTTGAGSALISGVSYTDKVEAAINTKINVTVVEYGQAVRGILTYFASVYDSNLDLVAENIKFRSIEVAGNLTDSFTFSLTDVPYAYDIYSDQNITYIIFTVVLQVPTDTYVEDNIKTFSIIFSKNFTLYQPKYDVWIDYFTPIQTRMHAPAWVGMVYTIKTNIIQNVTIEIGAKNETTTLWSQQWTIASMPYSLTNVSYVYIPESQNVTLYVKIVSADYNNRTDNDYADSTIQALPDIDLYIYKVAWTPYEPLPWEDVTVTITIRITKPWYCKFRLHLLTPVGFVLNRTYEIPSTAVEKNITVTVKAGWISSIVIPIETELLSEDDIDITNNDYTVSIPTAPEIGIYEVKAPSTVQAGVPFSISCIVNSTKDQEIRVQAYSGALTLYNSTVYVREGLNNITIAGKIDNPGTYTITVKIGSMDTYPDNNQATTKVNVSLAYFALPTWVWYAILIIGGFIVLLIILALIKAIAKATVPYRPRKYLKLKA